MVSHSMKYFIINLFFVIAFSQDYNFKLVATGDGVTYFNPSWGTDSKTFTVEVLSEDEFAAKTSKLHIGIYNLDDDAISWRLAFPEENESRRRRRITNKAVERNIGWIRAFNDEEQCFTSMYESNNRIYKIILDMDLDNAEDIYMEIEDEVLGSYKGEPSNFTSSNDRVYFVTLSENYTIYYTSKPDIDDMSGSDEVFNLNSKGNLSFDLPIRSLTVSNNDEYMLVATNSEALGEVYKFEINKNDNGIISSISDKILVPKPDNSLQYIGVKISPTNLNKYILIGSNENLDKYSNAYAFVVENDELKEKFLMYRHNESNTEYISPEIQFHPVNDHIFFLKPKEGIKKKLSYWNGIEIIETDLELDNIRDFRISPDGSYLLVVTFEPEDLYLYAIK